VFPHVFNTYLVTENLSPPVVINAKLYIAFKGTFLIIFFFIFLVPLSPNPLNLRSFEYQKPGEEDVSTVLITFWPSKNLSHLNHEAPQTVDLAVQWPDARLHRPRLVVRFLTREVYHSLSSIAEVKNEWIYTSTLPYAFRGYTKIIIQSLIRFHLSWNVDKVPIQEITFLSLPVPLFFVSNTLVFVCFIIPRPCCAS
jgi:hypothetical protein